jgi:hypothetical protein
MRLALGVGVLVVMTFALTDCSSGSSQEKAKARTLPEQHQELRPGEEYRSEEFKPSVSFRVGEGWSTSPPETSDVLQLEWGETGAAGLAFTKVQKVYKPTKTTTPTLVEAPEDLVGWFQNHPYLKTDKPEPITVGGVKGQQFDLIAKVPEDHLSICGADCVDAIKYTGNQVVFFEGDKIHAIVLEDVKGETVYLDYGALASDFDKVVPEAQKLVDSVKWGGS